MVGHDNGQSQYESVFFLLIIEMRWKKRYFHNWTFLNIYQLTLNPWHQSKVIIIFITTIIKSVDSVDYTFLSPSLFYFTKVSLAKLVWNKLNEEKADHHIISLLCDDELKMPDTKLFMSSTPKIKPDYHFY